MTSNLQGLKDLGATLAAMRPKRVHVGIFGNKTHRKDKSGVTNAEVGRVHELGSPEHGIPQRSFLRMPITVKKKEILAMASQGSEMLLAKGKSVEFLRRIGIACENVIEQAFSSAGFGSWAQNKYATIIAKLRHTRYKKIELRRQMAAETIFEGARHTTPLWDTGQLARSIDSRVK